MARYDTFTFRVTPDERGLIAAIAERLERSQSDAVRFLVRGAARELGIAAGSGEKLHTPAGERQGKNDARR